MGVHAHAPTASSWALALEQSAMVMMLVMVLLENGSKADAAATGTINRGYPLKLTTLVGSWFYATFPVLPSEVMNGTTGSAITIFFDSTGVSAFAASVDFYWAYDSVPSTSSTHLGSKSINSTSDAAVTFTVPITTYGEYQFAGFVTRCATCLSKIYEVTVQAALVAAGVPLSFVAIHNLQSLDYQTPVGTFSAPSATHQVQALTDSSLTATDTIYVKIVAIFGRPHEEIIITCNLGSTPSNISTVSMRYPLVGHQVNGTYVSSGFVLGVGTWYLTPYCLDHGGSLVSSTCDFSWIIGINEPPSINHARSRSSSSLILPLTGLILAALVAPITCFRL